MCELFKRTNLHVYVFLHAKKSKHAFLYPFGRKNTERTLKGQTELLRVHDKPQKGDCESKQKYLEHIHTNFTVQLTPKT